MAKLMTTLEPEKAYELINKIASELGFDKLYIDYRGQKGKKKKMHQFTVNLAYKTPKEHDRFCMVTYKGSCTKAICSHGYALFWLKYIKHDPEATMYNQTTRESLRRGEKMTYRFDRYIRCNCPEELIEEIDREMEKIKNSGTK